MKNSSLYKCQKTNLLLYFLFSLFSISVCYYFCLCVCPRAHFHKCMRPCQTSSVSPCRSLEKGFCQRVTSLWPWLPLHSCFEIYYWSDLPLNVPTNIIPRRTIHHKWLLLMALDVKAFQPFWVNEDEMSESLVNYIWRTVPWHKAL